MRNEIPMSVIYIDDHGQSILETINLADVDFIENEGKRVVYNCGPRKYYQISTKSELEYLLEDEGFDVLDRPFLVNMKKIQHYNPVLGKVYFESVPTKESKFVTVAHIKKGFVEKFINRIVSHHQNTTTEVTTEAPASGLKKLLKGLNRS